MNTPALLELLWEFVVVEDDVKDIEFVSEKPAEKDGTETGPAGDGIVPVDLKDALTESV